jgi:hypothetical protein
MLTEIELPSQTVIGAHLFKSMWANDCKERLGFDDINSPRNGMLWFKPLEYAFDNSHICYHFEVQTETFHMKILDPRLRGMTFREYINAENEMDSNLLLRTRDKWLMELSKKPNKAQDIEKNMAAVDNLLSLLDVRIDSFEGKTFMVAEEKCYSRCLSFQASMARLLAIENGWITKEEMDSPGMFSELEEKKKNELHSWLKSVEVPSGSVPIDD